MSDNASLFLDLYRQLEDALEMRTSAKEKAHTSLVMDFINSDEGAPWRDRLNLCREVRNLLSHNADLDGEAPLQPAQALIDTLRAVVIAIRSAPLALTRATGLEDLLTAHMNDAVVPLMRRMSEKGFSHVPVMTGLRLAGVFSVGTIFAAGLQGRAFTLTMDTTLRDMHRLLPPENHLTERFRFVRADALLPDVTPMFASERRTHPRRVAAVFLTDDGTERGALKGMLTPWDIIKPENGAGHQL